MRKEVRRLHTLLPALSFSETFSPTVVVARSGPGLFPFSCPNFAHVFRSATEWSTTAFCNTRLIFRVIYTISSERRGSWTPGEAR